MGSNCYVVLDDSQRHAVVVDPSFSYDRVVALLGFTPDFQGILLTHGHADHMLSLKNWRESTGASVMIGQADAYALDDPQASCASLLGLGNRRFGEPDVRLSDGEEIAVGSERLRVISTPGHSYGSLCYYCTGHLLSGDTLFASGGIGRSDLFGGDESALHASVALLMKLPRNTVVYPGHGPETTIGNEICFHRYFH